MAAAKEAEARHQERVSSRSPLEGLAYDVRRGELSMFRFVATATDEQVAAAAMQAQCLSGDDLANYRVSFTQDDLYTLLAFARRVTVRALRGDTGLLLAAWVALGIVDVERVDWRDAVVATRLLAFGSARAGSDLHRLVADAAVLSRPKMTAILGEHAVCPTGGLAGSGYREVSTAEGAAIVDDYGRPYAPTVDLLGIAASVYDAIEHDRYHITGITTGSQVAPVWLPGIERDAAEVLAAGVRGCLSISAAPFGGARSASAEQTLLIYVAECVTRDEAARLASTARQPAASDVAEIAVCSETLTLIAVARSTVKGVAPIETSASLERFRGLFMNALSGG